MICYQVTVNVQNPISAEWFTWMKNKHIPDVMKTGIFSHHNFYRVLENEEKDSLRYIIQYFCETIEHYEHYRREFAPALQRHTLERYGEHIRASRLILEAMD